jgi:hypothetical protein
MTTNEFEQAKAAHIRASDQVYKAAERELKRLVLESWPTATGIQVHGEHDEDGNEILLPTLIFGAGGTVLAGDSIASQTWDDFYETTMGDALSWMMEIEHMFGYHTINIP